MAQFWYASARGRRPSMEDIHLVAECPISKWIVFAVCDGHGGTAAVKYLETILSKRVLMTLAQASLNNATPSAITLGTTAAAGTVPTHGISGAIGNISGHSKSPYAIPVRDSYLRQCMKLLVISMDAELERELRGDEARNSGSTLIMMAYQPLTRQIVLVNLGDSRAVLSFPISPPKKPLIAAMPAVKSERKLIETKDHKPNDKSELLRVTAAGSFVKHNRVGGILALSRALGDFSLKKSLQKEFDPVHGAVCAMPDVQVGYISPTSFATAVLACDGIWDVMKSDEAVQVAETALDQHQNPAEKLVHTAFEKLSYDNLTCLVIRLHPILK